MVVHCLHMHELRNYCKTLLVSAQWAHLVALITIYFYSWNPEVSLQIPEILGLKYFPECQGDNGTLHCEMAPYASQASVWHTVVPLRWASSFLTCTNLALWLLLTRLGIPDKIVRLFRVLYDNSVSCVRTGGTHSLWFKIEANVRQGCVLSPDLFATGLDWLLDRTV